MTLCDQPDLAEFIQEHSTPYDPETDTYRRPPFAQRVKAGKSSLIYRVHTYHTKVPPEGVVPYIEHYTDPGDLVLDPFCGSGMIGVAALMIGRYAILSDLAPAAVHIASNYCTLVDARALERQFVRIQQAVAEEFGWLYGTTCDRCAGPATIQNTIWSDVFECERCANEIVLWEVAVDQPGRKVAPQFTCPHCGKKQKKLGLRKLTPVPVLTTFNCPKCRPKRSTHPVTEAEIRLIAEIEARNIPHWIPDTTFDPDGPQYRRNALSNRNIQRVVDLYTKRNLWATARLWSESFNCADPVLGERVRFAITAIMGVASRRNRWPQQQTISGTIYVPSLSVEMNVGEQFSRRASLVERAARFLETTSSISEVLVSVGSATSLRIPDSRIDYIFTDPPFGSSIYYSEVNLLWEAWLGDFSDTEKEAVVHRPTDGGTKQLADYAALMKASFQEMYRVLKPGRWASVVFHNSDDQIWEKILEAAETAGFERADINAFDKEQLSFKGIRGDKGLERVTNQDIVLNLLKPHPGRTPTPNGRTHLVEAEQRVVETVAAFLETNPPPGQRTLQHLWNHVLYDLLRDGSVQVSMADVEAMLSYHSQTFKLVDGRYFLRGEAVLGGNVFDLSSDAGAIAWLTAVLGNEPQTIGELIPTWQQETASLGGVDPGRLDRLLEQNFWQDERTGRWRVPTAAERERMSARADLSAQAHLRVVRRFLDGELDRRPTDWELCFWIRFCYNREFYAEAVALFPHVVEARVDPDEYREIKRIMAVCRMRAGESKE